MLLHGKEKSCTLNKNMVIWNNACRIECIMQDMNGEVDNDVGGGDCDYVKFTERTKEIRKDDLVCWN